MPPCLTLSDGRRGMKTTTVEGRACQTERFCIGDTWSWPLGSKATWEYKNGSAIEMKKEDHIRRAILGLCYFPLTLGALWLLMRAHVLLRLDPEAVFRWS